MLYSLTHEIFNDDLEAGFRRLSELGYDCIEIPGPSENLTAERVLELSEKYGLPVYSVNGGHFLENDHSSIHPEVRRGAIRMFKETIDLAARVGAKRILCIPSGVVKLQPEGTVDEEWNNAVESLRECADYADKKSPELIIAIEPVNFHESYLVNRLSTACQMMKDIDRPNVRLMADTFHMELGERNVPEALREVMPYVCHFHVSDSNREAPGLASQDLRAIFQVLVDEGYDGVITAEYIPREVVAHGIVVHAKSPSVFEETARQALREMKRLVEVCEKQRKE